MKTLELKPSQKNVIEVFTKDSIGRSKDVCAFVNLINNIEEECAIGVDGKWGTGKTFFVKQAKCLIDSFNINTQLIDKNDREKMIAKASGLMPEIETCQPMVTVYYDAWMHDDEEDPILSILFEIMKGSSSNTKISNKRDWMEILATAYDAYKSTSVNDFIKAFRGTDYFAKQRDNEELDNIISNFLSSLLPECGNKLVIFVDELDRCSPSYAIKLLERVKHYYNIENILFVFSVNFSELLHSIKNFYGEGFDACRYLDRFFDLRMELPQVDIRKYYFSIGVNRNPNMRERACMEIARQMNMGMREISRFFKMSTIAAYKYTDGNMYEQRRHWTEDNGNADLFCLCIVVPLVIGLKMTDISEYTEFVEGRNGSWLERIALSESLKNMIMERFRDDDETYSDVQGKKKVDGVERIRLVYKTLFDNEYDDSREFRKRIGSTVFTEKSKASILQAVSMRSDYSDYNV